MRREYQSVQETEPTIEGEILHELAKGKPYLFLTANVSEDGTTLEIGMHTNIPGDESHITKYLLEGVLDTLREHTE